MCDSSFQDPAACLHPFGLRVQGGARSQGDMEIRSGRRDEPCHATRWRAAPVTQGVMCAGNDFGAGQAACRSRFICHGRQGVTHSGSFCAATARGSYAPARWQRAPRSLDLQIYMPPTRHHESSLDALGKGCGVQPGLCWLILQLDRKSVFSSYPKFSQFSMAMPFTLTAPFTISSQPNNGTFKC